MQGKKAVCYDCEHFVEEKWNLHCDAFPDGIPAAILIGGDPHTKPFPGDHGIQFKNKGASNG